MVKSGLACSNWSIDLILQQGTGLPYMVIKCKRQSGGALVFLIPEEHKERGALARCQLIDVIKSQPAVGGCDDFLMGPDFPES